MSTGVKIANKNPMDGKIIICEKRPINKTFRSLKTLIKFLMFTLIPTPSIIMKITDGANCKIMFIF